MEEEQRMINWLSTNITVPEAGREIIAKNPLKASAYNTASKQCRTIKFLHTFTEDQIKSTLLDDNFTLWAYTNGTCDE